MPFQLPPLPYPVNALEPVLSRWAVSVHRDIHAGYIAAVNATPLPNSPLIGGSAEAGLLHIAQSAAGRDQSLYQAAAQAYNHQFFWHSMRPHTGESQHAEGELRDMIGCDCGNMASLREEFIARGLAVFGAGWAWLVLNEDLHLEVHTTHNEGNPILRGLGTPLLACDLWEHSYFYNFPGDRAHYISQWFDLLANFEWASQIVQSHVGTTPRVVA